MAIANSELGAILTKDECERLIEFINIKLRAFCSDKEFYAMLVDRNLTHVYRTLEQANER